MADQRGSGGNGSGSGGGGLGALLRPAAADRGRLRKRFQIESIALYERGLVYRRTGEPPAVAAWSDVLWVIRTDTVVKRFGSGRTRHRLSIGLPGRPALALGDEFVDIEAIADAVAKEVTEARLPLVAADLAAGRTVPFCSAPAVSIDPRGIVHGGERLDWTAMAPITLYQGEIHIRRRRAPEAWRVVPVNGFPDATLFLTVAEAMRVAYE